MSTGSPRPDCASSANAPALADVPPSGRGARPAGAQASPPAAPARSADMRARSGLGRLSWSGYLIGFALGGFFDGIVLHQILQWHHLLSLVDGVTDQVMFDGLFHALMYAVAAIGLVNLYRSRHSLAGSGSGGRLLGAALIGAGAWHVADGVLSHWVLGIHRIKLDSANPLAWDIGWFVAFGLLPIVAGRSLQRGRGHVAADGGAAAVGLAIAALLGGAWSGRPPAGSETAVMLFRPGTSQGTAVNTILAADGRVLWHAHGLWFVRWKTTPSLHRLYQGRALFVSRSIAGAGCLAWSRDG